MGLKMGINIKKKFILPSVKLNNMLYVAKTPVTVSQFTGKSNAGVNGASSGDFPVTNICLGFK